MEKKSSRYAVYAIGEIVLVVLGILIALQVNNWNEKRKEQAEEQVILKDLQRDFQDNLIQLKDKIRISKRADANIESIATKYMNQETALSSDFKVDSLYFALLVRSSFDPKMGSLNELLSSGKLRIIQNKELRTRLSSWSSYLQEVREVETHLWDVQERIYDYLYDKFPMANLLSAGKGWRSISFESNFSIDHSSILRDLEFENILSLKTHWMKYIFHRYGIIEQEMNEILRLIEIDLK